MISRNELIKELLNLHKQYKFDKYTDAQLYRIYQKELAKAEAKKAEKNQNDFSEKELDRPRCDICGNYLTDAGECPLCDLGDESVIEEELTFKYPQTELQKKSLDDLLANGYKLEKIPLEKIIKDNDLLNDDNLNYHSKIWKTSPDEYMFDSKQISNWLYSDGMYATRKKDGKIELSNGKHRCRALFNSGYSNIEIPVLDEAIEKHDELNPKLYDDKSVLHQEVKEKLLEIANHFIDKLKEDGVDIEVKDIRIVGSNANFNYTGDSDIDLHIIASKAPDCDKNHLDIIYQAYKTNFNSKYDFSISGIPVEIYVEFEDDQNEVEDVTESLNEAVSGGEYSVMTDTWIHQPIAKDIPDIDQEQFSKTYKAWENRAKQFLAKGEVSDIDNFINSIYEYRQEGLSSEDAEFSIPNLVFKELRNDGYLDQLKDKKVELENKNLSLDSVDESDTLKLLKPKSLQEALTPSQKIDMWHDGTRIVNVKLCSNDKLHNYYEIALSKGYREICDRILTQVILNYGCDTPAELPEREHQFFTRHHSNATARNYRGFTFESLLEAVQDLSGEDVRKLTLAFVKEHGYEKGSMVHYRYGSHYQQSPTVIQIKALAHQSIDNIQEYISDADIDNDYEDICTFASNLHPTGAYAEYEQKCLDVWNKNIYDQADLSILASFCSKFYREQQYQARQHARQVKAQQHEREIASASNVWAGEVGDTVTFTISEASIVRWISGSYYNAESYPLYNIKDDQGRIYTWGDTSGEADLNPGDRITGKIRELTEFRGIKQTRLTRVKKLTPEYRGFNLGN